MGSLQTAEFSGSCNQGLQVDFNHGQIYVTYGGQRVLGTVLDT